jgi:hypothetical protein
MVGIDKSEKVIDNSAVDWKVNRWADTYLFSKISYCGISSVLLTIFLTLLAFHPVK